MIITTLEYAKISAHTYQPENSLFGRDAAQFTKTAGNMKTIVDDGWYYFSDVIPSYTPHRPFFPALYIKYKFGEAVNAVIAIRGSRGVEDYNVDIHTWYKDIFRIASSDELPIYYPFAVKFLQTARAYIRHYIGEPRLTLTGHSLGGALAQCLVGVACKPFYAVTFNSPGIGHFKAIHMDMAPWVKNVNSRYGFINKIGKPFGEIVYVDVPQMETEAKAAWAALHDKAQTMNALERNNDLLTDVELLQRLDIDTLIACDGFSVSVYPQHKIDNMIPVVDGI